MTPHPSTARTLPELAAAFATATAAAIVVIAIAVPGSGAALPATRPEGAR